MDIAEVVLNYMNSDRKAISVLLKRAQSVSLVFCSAVLGGCFVNVFTETITTR